MERESIKAINDLMRAHLEDSQRQLNRWLYEDGASLPPQPYFPTWRDRLAQFTTRLRAAWRTLRTGECGQCDSSDW